MNSKTRVFFFALCLASIPMLTPSSSAAELCYERQTAGPAPGALAPGMSEFIHRQFLTAMARGDDSAAFFDTTRFGFTLIFYNRNPDTLKQEPKGALSTRSVASDSLTDAAYVSWARIMYSKYPLYDDNDPAKRLQPPDSASRYQFGMATYAVLGALSHECFTSYIDLGGPQSPVSAIPPKRNGDGAGQARPNRVDPLGRKIPRTAMPGTRITLTR